MPTNIDGMTEDGNEDKERVKVTCQLLSTLQHRLTFRSFPLYGPLSSIDVGARLWLVE